MYFSDGYDAEEAKVCMTLSTLAYASENNPTEIKRVIVEQLADTDYATGNEWELAWGPGLVINNSNMLYVVQHKKIPSCYAIAIRGTDPSFVFNIIEDIGVLHLLPYTEAQQASGIENISLAAGTWLGLQSIVFVQGEAAATGQSMTIIEFFKNIIETNGEDQIQIFITGHSLGGCLANVLTTWMTDNIYNLNLPNGKVFLKTYTFAAPTGGNQQYADYCGWQFNEQSRVKVESFRVYNQKDLVPYAWSSLQEVVSKGIPTTVPLLLVPIVEAVDNYFAKHGISYVHIDNACPIQKVVDPGDCNQSIDILDYSCWILFEHATATYLQLLGAPPVDEVSLRTTEIVFA